MIIMALRKDGNSRSSTSYKPYDPSNSFVKKMTNTVTGLFGWRSNLQSDSQNFNDILNSTSEDDRIAPAAKRMKVQCDENKTLLKFVPNSGKGLQDTCSPIKPVNDVNAAGPSNRIKCMISSTPASAFQRSPVFSNTLDQFSSKRVTQNAEDSEIADTSTFPQFSVHQRHNITVPSVPKDVPSMMPNIDATKSFTGSFSSTNSRRPSFNVDVFSSSSRRLSLSVCEGRNRNCLSPFYSARTMYGGASALLPYGSQTASRMRSASTSKLDVFSPRSQITMQPVPSPSKLNDQEILSASARRILDSLEKYCSPVMDAKRIPVHESNKKSIESTPQSLNRGVKRKLPALNQMLPSTSELLRIKRSEKMQDSISSAKQTVSTVPESSIIAEDSDSSSDSAELDYSMLSQESKDTGSQYVRKLTRKNESKFDDRPVRVNLPNATLKISNLPKFDVTDEFVFSKPLLLENLNEKVDESATDDVVKKEKLTSTLPTNSPIAASTVKTSFNDVKKNVSSIFSQSISKNMKSASNISPTSRITTNPTFSPSKSFLSNSTSSTKSSSSNRSSPKPTNWTCMKCFTVNTADECSKCSQSRHPKAEPVATPIPAIAAAEKDDAIAKAPIAASNWGDKFKPPADTWECPECMVRNKNTNSDCVACGKAKNNVSKSSSTVPTSGSTTFSSSGGFDWKNFKKPTGWSCNNCYVQNKEVDTKCAACEQAREPFKNDITAFKETAKQQFSFGIDKSGAAPSLDMTNSIKFGAIDKTTTSISFGLSSGVSATVSAPSTFSFDVNQSSQSTGNVNNVSATTVSSTDSNVIKTSAPTFTFGSQKSTIPETSVSNTTLNFKNPLLSTGSVFGSISSDEKVTERAENSLIFNDVSSTSNTKNPLLANDSSVFKTPKFVAPKAAIINIQENGEINSSNTNTSLFNDISSSTETQKKKVSVFSSVLNNEPCSGSNTKNDIAVTNGGGSTVSSSSNAFVTSISTSAFTPAGSKLTNDTHLSFAAAASSKTDTTLFGDKSGSASKLFSGQNSSFGNTGVTPSNPPLFGNTIGVNTNAIGSLTTVKSSETPPLTTAGVINASFSSAKPSFTFGANAISLPTATATLKSSEPSLTNSGAAPLSFTSVAATQAPVFSFGANVASTQPAVTQPAGGGGFMFNGPKAEDGAPKFGFGAVNTTPFGGGASGSSSQFSFGAAAPIHATTETNERPTTNSLFGGIAAGTAPVNKTPVVETPALNTNSITAFGNSVFGATPSQPANPVKKSGGFSFNAPSPFSTSAVNNFASFTTPPANQEPKAPSTFVFGSSNQTPQTHNFNPTIPPAFNFSGGNQLTSFSAQPTATNATQNACGPQRKIKKAVRRTTQK